MGVSVLYKRGQEWLRLAGRPNLLGHGLLERARAISLALLGATAAVGLAIVALALNQGWPLIAGGSIPLISPQHQAVGEAEVAAGVGTVQLRAGRTGGSVHAGSAGGGAPGHRRHHAGGAGDSVPADSTELVVAQSSPVKPDDGPAHDPPRPEPTPVVQQPQAGVQAVPAATTHPAAESPTAPSASPPAVTSESPVGEPDSAPPSWSHGGGHAYGHDDDWDDDHDWDDDDGDSDGWHGHGGGWHGHRHDD